MLLDWNVHNTDAKQRIFIQNNVMLATFLYEICV